ncbi:MAG: UDP-Glc:alpha-D-GlcNAc-diphosphoundecaprenol beta-1,3-glucosyltransferase WfgD [Syntrophorhabdus sp. PtaU1.Bin058]|nr:MAG: UDP-Glc:alpha-D-GlcNAc-diphosphoundecaprenol beta-1,3-glucosyltransferase WfgD [Syntrophorhabdus sp. PtaU1.Bin058]
MVSVIITTYNRRRFLREAVLSVLEQDYRDREVIVVDDGSTDGSHDEVGDLPVTYIRKENGGISSARNKGIETAGGAYIAFLDVDDLWKKKKLSTQMAQMADQDYVLSYTDEIWIRNGKRLNQRLRHKKYSGRIFEHCLPLCIISPSSAVIRREVFEDVGLFDESLPVCEDYDMWLRVTARYPVLFIERPLIVKRGGHEDQLSRQYAGMDRFRIEAIVKILKDPCLKDSMREKAVEELKRKCRIYANGAMRRDRVEEAQYYLSLVGDYEQCRPGFIKS